MPSDPKPSTDPRPTSKRRLRLVISVALGIVGALVAGELAVRILGIEPERHAPPRWEVWDDGAFQRTEIWGAGRIRRRSPFERLGVRMGEYVPEALFRIVFDSDPRGVFEPDGGVTMAVNQLGLRGPDVLRKKPPGTFRVLGLGDSFTFGVGVRDEHTFLRRLEAALDTGEQPVEVLNAGVQGYNTRDEVVCLEHRWLALDPDLVLITFYLNDAYSDAAFWNMGEGLGAQVEGRTGLARVSRIYDLLQYARRVSEAGEAIERHYRQHYFDGAFLEGDDHSAEFRVDWTTSRDALRHAKRLLDDRGIPLALVIFPELFALDGEYPFDGIHAVVRAECQAAGIPVLDLLPTFRGRDASALWVHPSDHHPNEDAHGLAAAAIEQFLAEQGLVPR